MKPRICICCAEPMHLHANTLSGNPNMCASCSSLTDGMDEEERMPELSLQKLQFQSGRVDSSMAATA